MTDREKTINDLKICYKVGHDPLIHDALELLKEQEPAKPILRIDTWICPKCGHNLESQELIDDTENPQVLIHELYNYCPNCGKPVKWDE